MKEGQLRPGFPDNALKPTCLLPSCYLCELDAIFGTPQEAMLGSLALGLPQGHGTSSLGHGPSASPSSSSSSPSPLALAPENTRILRGDWLAVHIGKDIFSVESYGAKGATLAWITVWLSTHTTICAIHCR